MGKILILKINKKQGPDWRKKKSDLMDLLLKILMKIQFVKIGNPLQLVAFMFISYYSKYNSNMVRSIIIVNLFNRHLQNFFIKLHQSKVCYLCNIFKKELVVAYVNNLPKK